MIDRGPVAIWGVIVAIGVATFAVRFSFIYLFGRISEMPTRLQKLLRFVPAAVLAALVAPALVTLGPTVQATLLDEHLLAGAVAAAVAWRTENVFATIATGMIALWVLRFLVL
ncbi:AzlD domain-containing protein [Halosolutus halophilus]|uniref:AzlD domain-containing protein n=1 Tax=Halosolutus halophilus TaxID=1552990 RepID=UPI002235282F|nr:AzlD domain-containing protein [Halosolutus halophilus]